VKHTAIRTLFSLVLTICTVIFFSALSQAATLTVTNTSDSGVGSLRAAVAQSNTTLESDTINFSIPTTSPNCTANGICTIKLTSGELSVLAASTAGSLTITNATGAGRLLISGNNQSRVFFVNNGATLTLDGVTITGGTGNAATNAYYDGYGGGIYNKSGTVMLTNSAISGNTATFGAAVYNYNWIRGSLTLVNSTISGNTAFYGGGIYNNYGVATLMNSTVSGNTAQANGGGFYNDYSSVLNLINATVTRNRSSNAVCTDCAGGVFNYNRDVPSTVNLLNTIIAENIVANAVAASDFSGNVSPTSSNNIIGSSQLTNGVSNGVNNNQVGNAILPVNPMLSPLGNYGGTTETHSLLSGSPATDKGNNCVLNAGGCGNGNLALVNDQRGANFSRQLGGSVDIGAVELAQSSGSYDVSGTIVYGTTPAGQTPKYVSGVTVFASGTSRVSAETDSAGSYMLRNLIAGGQYVVTPSKTGGVNGVTPFDATLVLRHVAAGGNGTLTANQLLAADTNNSNSITPFDATQILRFVAANGQTTTTGTTGNWKFISSARNYSSVTNSVAGENYDAVVVGDVNGSWTPQSALPNEIEEDAQEKIDDNNQFKNKQQHGEMQLELSIPANATSVTGSDVAIPVQIKNNGGKAITSFSFDVVFDPNILQPQSSAVGTAEAFSGDFGCTIVTDIKNNGRIGIAGTCPTNGITAFETHLNLLFTVVGTQGATALTLSQPSVFEDNNGQVFSLRKTSGIFTVTTSNVDTFDNPTKF
jgi:hypothetical protein